MLGSAIQSFNDCIYVVLSSGSHWWQTFMTAWGWNPWPSMQLCNEVDILGDFGWLNLVRRRDSTRNRGGSTEHVSSRSKGHEDPIKYSGFGHPRGFHLSPFVGQSVYREISQHQEDDLAKNLVPPPHRVNTKDFGQPLTVYVAPSSAQSFKLSTIYSNTFYTNAHNMEDGHLITAGKRAPLFVF